MKNIFTKAWGSITAHKIITGIVIVAVLIGGYITYTKVYASNKPTQYVLSQVARGTLISSVEGTGQVSAMNQLNVTPQGSGVITAVNVKQGDKINLGQSIAVIDERSATISLNQAKSNLESAQASYNKLINGAASANVTQSELSVQSAEQDLSTTVKSAYTQVDNLIKTDLDQFFSGPTTYSPQFQINFFDSSSNTNVTLTPPDENLTLNINAERVQIKSTLNSWATDLTATSTLDAEGQVSRSLIYLNHIGKFVDDIANAINSLYLNQTRYQSNLSSFKTDAANARSTVNSIITNLQNGQQAVANAKASLNVTTAPPRPEDVTAAEVQVKNAEAAVQTAQNNYNNNIVSAPFAGEVAALNVHVGDLAGGSTVIATLTTPQKLALISLNEVDVAKIALGNKATLTFDALPDLTISGTVAEIDTIGTVTQGVVDYTVKIALDVQDERILPGMSVSASIITSSKDGVLIVPSSAVKTDSAGSYVQEISGQNVSGTVSTKIAPINVPVQVGNSNDTETEITSGLNEGDLVIARSISNSTTPSAASSGGSLFGGGRAGGGGGSGAASRVPR